MNKLIDKYLTLKIPSSNDLTPRTGYYALGSFEEITKATGQKQIIASALWSDNPMFKEFIEVKVNIASIYNGAAIGPKSIIFSELTNSVIEIKEICLLDYFFKGTPARRYKVTWDIIGSISDVIRLYRFKAIKREENQYYENEILMNYYQDQSKENIKNESEIKWLKQEMELDYYLNQIQNQTEDALILDELNEDDHINSLNN